MREDETVQVGSRTEGGKSWGQMAIGCGGGSTLHDEEAAEDNIDRRSANDDGDSEFRHNAMVT